MHFHLPKPLHGWRAFAGEVGIIVVGVLIALTAEQVVETIHWDRQADKARAALRSEVGKDNLPQAYVRLAIAPCVDAQLKTLQSAVDNRMDRSRFAVLAVQYAPPSRTWDSEAWNAVVATGVLAHGGADELINWSLPYRAIIALGPASSSEQDYKEQLRSISTLPGQLTPAELDRVTVALEHLRREESRMTTLSALLLASARKAGVELSPTQRKQTLDEVRSDWGKCMIVPVLRDFDIDSQTGPPLTS